MSLLLSILSFCFIHMRHRLKTDDPEPCQRERGRTGQADGHHSLGGVAYPWVCGIGDWSAFYTQITPRKRPCLFCMLSFLIGLGAVDRIPFFHSRNLQFRIHYRLNIHHGIIIDLSAAVGFISFALKILTLPYNLTCM